jgi:serine/threonine-protein kinase
VWSPDGRFLVSPRPSGGIDWLAVDRHDPPQPLLASPALQIPWSFSGAGGRLAYYERGLRPGSPVTFDLWTVPVRRDGHALSAGRPEPFLVSDAFELYPSFSPDGRWIAYASLASGAYEIHVRAFPDAGRQWRISPDGGVAAAWSRDGRRLYYVSTDRRVMVVDWPGDPDAAGAPRAWSDHRLADTGVLPNFDLGPDGTIAALMPAAGSAPSQDARHVSLVVNALSEVQRLAPVR